MIICENIECLLAKTMDGDILWYLRTYSQNAQNLKEMMIDIFKIYISQSIPMTWTTLNFFKLHLDNIKTKLFQNSDLKI